MSRTSLRVAVPETGSPAYSVHVGQGLLRRLGELTAAALPAKRYAIIADERVGRFYGEAARASLADAGLDGRLFTFPAGEGSKTRESWGALTDGLLEAGYGRDSAVVALGGGVTGDLAGFVAATYMRGVSLVGVPTSLLAMLDSSVGGKTAVDTSGGKNSVGVFHHPALVVVDPELLDSLPDAHRRAGLAEAVKAAAIRDAELFAWIESRAEELAAGSAELLTELIRRCIRIKADIVSVDPREAGVREVLNFGHTAGHALEVLSGYEILHGRAVAAGMRLEARVGEAAGITSPGTADRLDAVIRGCGIPAPDRLPSASRLLGAAASDKKVRAGVTRWVLLERIGVVARTPRGAWAHPLTTSDAESWLTDALRETGRVADSS